MQPVLGALILVHRSLRAFSLLTVELSGRSSYAIITNVSDSDYPARGTEVHVLHFSNGQYLLNQPACWNICTGDIGVFPVYSIPLRPLLILPGVEDAPAPAALHSFKVDVVNGKIHVTANPDSTVKQNMKRNPRLLTEDTSFKTGLVIVGGGSGAFYAVESLREVCGECLLAMFLRN
jgi:hypothetical protein